MPIQCLLDGKVSGLRESGKAATPDRGWSGSIPMQILAREPLNVPKAALARRNLDLEYRSVIEFSGLQIGDKQGDMSQGNVHLYLKLKVSDIGTKFDKAVAPANPRGPIFDLPGIVHGQPGNLQTGRGAILLPAGIVGDQLKDVSFRIIEEQRARPQPGIFARPGALHEFKVHRLQACLFCAVSFQW